MPITTELMKIDNAALTTKNVDGTGLFDVLMKSMHNHLRDEFEKNRITGQEYTKAYIELSSVALNGAIQFLLQKDSAYLQGLKIELETKTLEYNLEHVLPLQKESVQKDNQIKDYNLTHILPQQKILLQEQIEVQRAQTLNNRTDGAVIAGSIGKQKDLYTQQITSYQRDAEVKAAKPFIDAWITQKTLDEGLVPPNGFTNSSLDTILSKLKTNNSLT